jgi:hypothetical protein
VPCVWSSGVSVAGGDGGQKYVISVSLHVLIYKVICIVIYIKSHLSDSTSGFSLVGIERMCPNFPPHHVLHCFVLACQVLRALTRYILYIFHTLSIRIIRINTCPTRKVRLRPCFRVSGSTSGGWRGCMRGWRHCCGIDSPPSQRPTMPHTTSSTTGTKASATQFSDQPIFPWVYK